MRDSHGRRDNDEPQHRTSDGNFDADMLELQNAFLAEFLAPFLCEVHCPLVTLKNPRTQDDDIPDELIIQDGPSESPSGWGAAHRRPRRTRSSGPTLPDW